jgi:hypothetical protein
LSEEFNLPKTHFLPFKGGKLSDFHEMAKNLSAEQSGSNEAKMDRKKVFRSIHNGGRRLGFERRQFAYSHYIPERRIGSDRRMTPERRVDEKERS